MVSYFGAKAGKIGLGPYLPVFTFNESFEGCLCVFLCVINY